jgi:membrane fusion protein (multidrug efflux system)
MFIKSLHEFAVFIYQLCILKLSSMASVFRSLIILPIGLSVLISSCSKKEDKAGAFNRQKGPIGVEGFLVQPRIVSENVEVPGTLLPVEETQIRPEVSGRVVTLNVPEGTVVPQDFLLAKLFDQDLQAQLCKLQIQLQISEKTVERQKELLAINGISQQDFDLSSLSVDNLKADIQTTRIQISKTEIRAPYEGKIGLRNVSLGAYVSANDIITTLRQVNQLKLEFSIPEKYAKFISKGYEVKFKVDGGNKAHEAKVLATEGNVEQTTRTLKVRALIQKLDPELVPGLFAKVNLQLGRDLEALMVPTQSVIPKARNKQVIVLRKDSALFVTVQTGIRDSSFIQITSGLTKGDTVITTGLMAIRPNSKVKVLKVNRDEK